MDLCELQTQVGKRVFGEFLQPISQRLQINFKSINNVNILCLSSRCNATQSKLSEKSRNKRRSKRIQLCSLSSPLLYTSTVTVSYCRSTPIRYQKSLIECHVKTHVNLYLFQLIIFKILHGAVPRRLLSVKSAHPKLLSANATVTNGGKCQRPRQDKLKKSLLAQKLQVSQLYFLLYGILKVFA